MKSLRLNLISFVLLSTVLVISGCKKEETETNYFSIEDSFAKIPVKYGLGYSSIKFIEITSKNTYKYSFMVSSSPIALHPTSKDLSSDGDYVLFTLFSKDKTLPSGQYTYDPFYSLEENTISFCTADFGGTGSAIFYSGVMELVHRGNTLDLDFEFINTVTNPEISIKLKGYFEGDVADLTPSK